MHKLLSRMKTFLKFGSVSLTSSLIDMGLFQFFILLLKRLAPSRYILAATVAARVFSSLYNFLMNKKVVFKNEGGLLHTAGKYFALVIVQMLCSAYGVSTLYALTGFPELAVKIAVDTTLFLLSYQIQKHLVFHR